MTIRIQNGSMNPRDESGSDQSAIVLSQGGADVKLGSNYVKKVNK